LALFFIIPIVNIRAGRLSLPALSFAHGLFVASARKQFGWPPKGLP